MVVIDHAEVAVRRPRVDAVEERKIRKLAGASASAMIASSSPEVSSLSRSAIIRT